MHQYLDFMDILRNIEKKLKKNIDKTKIDKKKNHRYYKTSKNNRRKQ